MVLQRARRRVRIPFIIWIGLGNAVAFCFGWHVHEKAILMIHVPLLMGGLMGGGSTVVGPTDTWRLAVLANAAVMPLLFRAEELILNWVILAAGIVIHAYLLDIDIIRAQKWWLVTATAPQFYGDFLHHHILADNYWFLPLALNSVMTALLLTQGLSLIMRRIDAADKPKSNSV